MAAERTTPPRSPRSRRAGRPVRGPPRRAPRVVRARLPQSPPVPRRQAAVVRRARVALGARRASRRCCATRCRPRRREEEEARSNSPNPRRPPRDRRAVRPEGGYVAGMLLAATLPAGAASINLVDRRWPTKRATTVRSRFEVGSNAPDAPTRTTSPAAAAAPFPVAHVDDPAPSAAAFSDALALKTTSRRPSAGTRRSRRTRRSSSRGAPGHRSAPRSSASRRRTRTSKTRRRAVPARPAPRARPRARRSARQGDEGAGRRRTARRGARRRRAAASDDFDVIQRVELN